MSEQFTPVAALMEMVGTVVGVSDWFEVTQDRIDAFADATLDHQFIHVDPARAAAESPFGVTIAHGFLTLSLLPHLGSAVKLLPEGTEVEINYGTEKVRFPGPRPRGQPDPRPDRPGRRHRTPPRPVPHQTTDHGGNPKRRSTRLGGRDSDAGDHVASVPDAGTRRQRPDRCPSWSGRVGPIRCTGPVAGVELELVTWKGYQWM